jgi:tRNA (mo5U34)-methyltransferase
MSGPQRTSPSPAAAVLDALGPQDRDALLVSYEQGACAEITAGGDFTARLQGAPAAVRAAHQRRLELLDTLPLGDLAGKVCVDFGVGSRGFAASFPKLQNCGQAVGIDFSLAALKSSAEISARGQAPYGRNYKYLTSRGDRIDLPDGSVDVVYAGESIERVENIDAFLEEAHRILKPGGLLILTTIQAAPEAPCAPGAAPVFRAPEAPPGLVKRLARITPRKVFKRVGQMVRANPSLRRIARFVKRGLVGSPPAPVASPLAGVAAGTPAANPEQLGGLTYADLRRFLTARFDVLAAHGYAGPVDGPGALGLDTAAAQAWALQFADEPERARGVVLLARKRADYRPAGRYRQRRYGHDSHDLRLHGGPWEVTGLHRALSGRLATGGEASWLTLPVEGSAVVLHFWTNPWGGEAVIEVGGVRRTMNLYSPAGCFKRVHIDGLTPGRHELRIAGSKNRDPRSVGNQVIFYQAIAYGREDGPGQNGKPAGGRVLPARTDAERARLRQRIADRRWFHTIDLGDGIVTPGCDYSSAKVAYLGLPERLGGKSVLDIGAYDGFFSFECERRGAARVVAADHFCWTYGGMASKDGFDLCKAALGSRVEEAFLPVEDIAPERVGVFDLVLFLGVLYHAPDMVRYLRLVRSVCRGQVILETEIDAEDYPLPAAVFYPGNSLNNDASNFWGPNLACVEAMLREVGFRKVERVCTFNMVRRGNRPFHRAVFHAFV